MAFTAPRTWVTGETPSASLFNTHIRDNLKYLKGIDGVVTIESGLIIDSTGGTQYLTVPSLTTTERDALTAVNGMGIYNETVHEFQVYANGAWMDTVHQPELWFAVTTGTTAGSAGLNNYGDFPVANLTTGSDIAHITGHLPDDLTTLEELKLVVIPRASQAAANWDIETDYGAIGEAHTNHTNDDTASTYSVTADQTFEIDLKAIMTSLAAGDFFGIELTLQNSSHDVDVLGVRLKYT